MTPNPDPAEALEELPDDTEQILRSTPTVPASTAPVAPPRSQPAAGAPREMEKAPLELKKAGAVLFVAALFPWLSSGGINLDVMWAKLAVVLGACALYFGVLHRHGRPIPGALRALGGAHPKLLSWLGSALTVVGVLLPMLLIGAGKDGFSASVEVAAVAVGASLWVQIVDYSMGAKFNPVMGLIVPVFALAAIGRLIFLSKKFDVLAMLGSLGVLVAGVLAARTMVVAMKEAKAHGEAKKRLAVEQRMQDRAAKRRTN